MHNIVMKYESLVKDGQWDTKSEIYVEILVHASQLQELKILFVKQLTYDNRNKNINVGNTRFNNSGSTWHTRSNV